MFALFNYLFGKKEEKLQPMGGPYRMPAEMPAPIHDPPPPKPKRQFKLNMSALKPNKAVKVFLLLLPLCACLVGIGMVYDAPILGQGIKWGVALAQVVVGAFFSIKAFYTALDG